MDGLMPSNPGSTKVINNGYVMTNRSYHDPQTIVDGYLTSSGGLESHGSSQYHHSHHNSNQGSMTSGDNIPQAVAAAAHAAAAAAAMYNPASQHQATQFFQPNPSSNPGFYHTQQHDQAGLSSQMSQMSLDNIRAKSNYDSSSSASISGPHGKLINATSVPGPRNEIVSENAASSFFVLDFLREDILKKLHKNQELTSKSANSDLPSSVDVYVELTLIEKQPGNVSPSLNNIQSSVYRATHSENGQFYCLRRFHSIQSQPPNTRLLMSTIDGWKKLHHPNIVPLRQIFTTKAFGDNSVIFVYDYFPAPETLLSAYFAGQSSRNVGSAGGASLNNGYSTSSRPYSQQQNTPKILPEPTLWNFIIQIASALRTIHQANLAFRSLDLSKVLLVSGWSANPNNFFSNRGRNSRLRLAFSGVLDILDTFDSFHMQTNQRAFVPHYQQEDLARFGRIILALATNQLCAFTQLTDPPSTPGSVQNGVNNVAQASALQNYLEMVPRSYSNDLRNLIQFLVSCKSSPNGKMHSIDEIMPIIGARFFLQLDNTYAKYDYLYEELGKEMDNGRLLRLLIKLATINERPEHQMDPNWSETGDRYMLKLFRDYMFHQQFDEDGRPYLDLGHVVSSLNKFDVGCADKICLQSRDQQNIIIVSFEELKRCFEGALNDLAH